MPLLVIKAECETAEYVCNGLEQNGFTIVLARNETERCRLSMSETFDLILMDVVPADFNCWQLIKSVRDRGLSTPILVLINPDCVITRNEVLKQGADDYVVKPFTLVELLFHVRTLLRGSPSPHPGERLQFADLIVDIRRRRVTRSGDLIHLTFKEFSLLELLVRRQGEVLPRSFISTQVWGLNLDHNSNVIEVAIRRLRTKIDDPYALKLIHTVRGMGYLLDVLGGE